MTTTSSQRKSIATLLGIAQFGYAQWFLVRVPERLAADGRLGSVLGAGSPVLYYLPGGVILIGVTLAAVTTGWKSRVERRGLAVRLAVLAGLSATAYLVWTVNLKLFIIGHSVQKVEQSRLLTLWYRVNAMRLLTTGLAWIMAVRVGSRLRSDAGKP